MNNLITGKPAFTFDTDILSTWGKVEDNYKFHIKNFLSYARETTADSGIELIEDYFKSLNSSGLGASTVCCRRFAIKNRLRASMSEYGEAAKAAMEYSLGKIDKTIKAPGRSRQSIGADKVINDKEYSLLMEKARSDRQKRFIEFLFTTGSRVSEMTGITLSDCTVKNNTITIRLKGKGNARMDYKERSVFITLAMFERIKRTFNGKLYLFETGNNKRYSRSYVSNQLGKLTLKLLHRRIGAHGFRHSFATRVIKNTGRVSAVSNYLGHSDISLTLRLYTHDELSPVDVLGVEALCT